MVYFAHVVAGTERTCALETVTRSNFICTWKHIKRFFGQDYYRQCSDSKTCQTVQVEHKRNLAKMLENVQRHRSGLKQSDDEKLPNWGPG